MITKYKHDRQKQQLETIDRDDTQKGQIEKQMEKIHKKENIYIHIYIEKRYMQRATIDRNDITRRAYKNTLVYKLREYFGISGNHFDLFDVLKISLNFMKMLVRSQNW